MKRISKLMFLMLLTLLMVQPFTTAKASAKTTWYSSDIVGYSNHGINALRIKNNRLKLYGCYSTGSTKAKAERAYTKSLDSKKKYRTASLKLSKNYKVYTEQDDGWDTVYYRMSQSTFKKNYVNKKTWGGISIKVVNGVVTVIQLCD